ncbi:MAG: hypothetical protein Tsb002_34280 [Wenzhouxiangellaceae bacterium]
MGHIGVKSIDNNISLYWSVHMSRAVRTEDENAYYHVMSCGRGRRTVFHNADYFKMDIV